MFQETFQDHFKGLRNLQANITEGGFKTAFYVGLKKVSEVIYKVSEG